jgi:hypothetical protein
MIGRCGRRERHLEQTALQFPQDISSTDFAALIHWKEKARADKQ